MAWCQYYDDGRAWLTTLGHDARDFATDGSFPGADQYRKLILGGIESAMGTDGLRRQLAPRGTHVLEVLPPTTDTPMNAAATGPKLAPAEVAAVTLKALRERRPLALPGQAKLMPLMLRVAPRTLDRMVGKL